MRSRKPRRGRPPIGRKAMTPTQRQAKRRALVAYFLEFYAGEEHRAKPAAARPAHPGRDRGLDFAGVMTAARGV